MTTPTLPRCNARPRRTWLPLILGAALALGGCRSISLMAPDSALAPPPGPQDLLKDTAPGKTVSTVSASQLLRSGDLGEALGAVPGEAKSATVGAPALAELATTKPGPPTPTIVATNYYEATEPLGSIAPPPVKLGASVLPPPLEQRPVDLCVALERAGVGNPTIALAEEGIRASEALRLQARALLLPNINAGGNYRVHQGTLLSSAGQMKIDNLQSLYLGLGASAKAAETVAIPGVQFLVQLSDAYFAPLETEQAVVARRFEAVAVRNRTLLEVGTAYLALTGAQGELTALRRSAEDVDKVVQMTASFAKAGQGKDSDAERARSRRLLIENQAQQTEGQRAVAAAELSRLLDLDPSLRLVPTDPLPPVIELVNPATPVAQLLETAMARHPDLGARSAEVATAELRARHERVRPWLPLISAGFSLATFGGSTNQFADYPWAAGGRIDVDVAAVWTLQNAGAGTRATQNRARAEAGQAQAERIRTANRVREDVSAAYAQVHASRREVEIAQRRIERSQRAFEEDLRRSRNLEGRPIEVLRSLELLTNARVDLVRAMVGYSRAQLELYVALGNAPSCVGRDGRPAICPAAVSVPQPVQ